LKEKRRKELKRKISLITGRRVSTNFVVITVFLNKSKAKN